ncbi:fatty acid biosynthesis transcriptional regulator [Aneurinibacillus migulanus]|uniref:Transcription factor FapR n=1 Tax=Aneurinibacillus migulanus TaxID=47500 RepID=A0A0D1X786_ANEMI|nr:transcription factor FapR [Aneurinibacillus migulanus]KIV50386.1 fatty acid biosynthesis transcriptional regulator [Aneurinibacillus migulanus]KIV55652.1 fatty acid biosynthesis transcriptional regulator [Aneurinibacillus migulanus]KON95726.1 fatty acid biosynthesis transcriptional regulator [Aneurinibacillus migulanus]KPD06440.1 fatty acid biosynthesis transcriptional regulator [Aneurinibacillus migulanus]MCP1355632.1 transcription factor FapR [Aneurinibacillus migulanus]
MARLAKKARQEALHNLLAVSPFYTDEELAAHFGVSIQTIRLDRLELGIPEVRERIKNVAKKSLDEVKSLSLEEMVGELLDIELDRSGISLLEITEEHIFSRTQIARGHHIFAQANSLAVAVIDADVVLTAAARIRYIRPVRLGERLVAKAAVRETKGDQSKVRVETRVQDELVFSGTFRVFRMRDFDAQTSRKQEEV